MEICQFCEMYMKPFINSNSAECEFCGKEIATKKDNKWVKTIPEDTQ